MNEKTIQTRIRYKQYVVISITTTMFILGKKKGKKKMFFYK